MSHRRSVSRRLVALLLATAPTPALAQHAGDVSGTVSASRTRTPISGARVEISAPARITTSDQQGRFTLRDLPAGTYTVFVTAIGRTPIRQPVTLGAGGHARLDVSLDPGSLLLSSIVVSATRTPVEAAKVASTVSVLAAEHVRTSPAREAQDLLREVPSVELPRTSSLVGGSAQIVSIRGVDEGRTAVLFDGVPVNDAWGEWIDWGRVPKSMLDRVEVVEGGTSSLYGNGAMGGVISFFSRPMAPGAAHLQLDGGSRGTRHAYAAAGVGLGDGLTASLAGDYQEGGGYTLTAPSSDYNGTSSVNRGPIDVPSAVVQRNAYLRLSYATSSDWSVFATGHLFGDSRQLGTPLAFTNRDQRNVDLGVNHGGIAGGALSLRAWDGRQIEDQRATAIRSATLRDAEDSSLTATIPSHDWGASAMWTRTDVLGLESFSVGGDYRHMQGDFNEIDYSTSCPGATCGNEVRRISSGGDQSLSGLFAQALVAPWERLRVELSARVDGWSNENGRSTDAAAGSVSYPDRYKSAFSPRAGVRYQLLSSLALRGAVYRAFRAPNLAELYRKQLSATQMTVPNPDLSAETAVGREAGFDWQPLDWAQVTGTWYVAEYNDFNVPVTLTGADRPAACGTITTCRQRLNVSKSRSQGGEAYVALHPLPRLMLSVGVNYDDARQQSNIPAGTPNSQKPHINRVPSPRQTLRATWSSSMIGDWTAIVRHEGTTTTLQGLGLDPFTVADVNVQKEIAPGLRAFASVENIGDTRYQINVAGQGTTSNPYVVSEGLPRTVRVGMEAFHF